MKYKNHIEHSDRFLDYYKNGWLKLRPSSIQKQKHIMADGTKKTYVHIIEPYVQYHKYGWGKNWKSPVKNDRKVDCMIRDAIPKFVYENCCFCNSDKNIVKHHENNDMWYHFYFMCQSCHSLYHHGRFDK